MERPNWMQTYSDQDLDPFDPKPEKIRFEDIAHGLACTNRFAGQQKGAPYTVAQHCVAGSYMIEPKFALAFLMHELDEVYLGDVITQVKRRLRVAIPGADYDDPGEDWYEICRRHEEAIFEAIGATLPAECAALLHSPEVKAMDLAMLAWEHRDLMGKPPHPWNIGVEPPEKAKNTILKAWPWDVAELAWNVRFRELLKYPPQHVGYAVLP